MDPRSTSPSPLAPPEPSAEPSREPATEPHDGGHRVSGPAWLAATGASLLLLASVVVVAGRWQTVTPEVRFAGLVACLLAIYFTAESIRDRLVVTASALAVLAATITAPVGIAAAATVGQTWPICILIGGTAAMIAAEVQSRRWSVPALKAATAIACGLAVTGIAALTSAPVGVLGALAAMAALALGAVRRSIVLATAAGLVPFLVVLADAGIGPGTLARIGAVGAPLDWAAPVSSLLAAVVIGISAHRRLDPALVALAIAVGGVGAAIGLYRLEPVAVVWWMLPPFGALVLQAVASIAASSVWGRTAASLTPAVLAPLALFGAFGPALAYVARAINDLIGDDLDPLWALPPLLTAVTLFVASARWIGSRRPTFAPPVLFAAGCLSLVSASLIFGKPTLGWDDVATLWLIVGITATVAHRQHARHRSARWWHAAAAIVPVAAAASMVVAGFTATGASLTFVTLSVTATGFAFVDPRVNPIDTLAALFALFALAVGSQAAPSAQSVLLTVVGSQFALYAVARRQRLLAGLGGLLSVSAAASLWWTTGANETVIDWIAPYRADGSDVALAAAVLSLLLAGSLLRSLTPEGTRPSSWLAYSPGLGMATAWLLDAQLDGDGLWALLGGLTTGVVAVGIGGWHRLGAPLVLGSVLLAASLLSTLITSIGAQLAEAPAWSWIASGGLGLLLAAALLERSERPLLISKTADELTHLERFRRDFD